ncbi:MAG: GNAT family N-acetyltransferase [Saprospiraceae bacterium]
MDELSITEVVESEIGELFALMKKTFLDAFEKDNTKEDIQLYLTEKLNNAQVAKEYHETNSKFYFARIKGHIIGYLKLNYDKSLTDTDSKSLEIERIYIAQEHQGYKYGQVLLDFAIDKAKEIGTSNIWLGVWEKNSDAIRFYQKNGFEIFDQYTFLLGRDKQTDLLMKLLIS